MVFYNTIKTISVLCFSFVTITLTFFDSEGLKVKFRISSMKFCLKSEHILTTLTQISLSQCVDECATRTDCKAANYFNRLHTCELIPDDDEELIENARRNRACVFVKKTDMDISEINDKCACDTAETCNVEPDTTCDIKECKSFTLRNGRVNGNMRCIGASVTFECNQLYMPTFQTTGATCLANGTWSHKLDCEADADDLSICDGCILPRDCQDIKTINETAETGVFEIYPTGSKGFMVRCDMDTLPGGWTVFQRRESNSDFQKDWEAYKEGFGQLNGNFWLGNDKLWKLTRNGQYKLRVDLIDQNGSEGYAEYSSFSIGNESTKYVLNIAGHSGTATDSLVGRHSGMMFTTIDQDNDIHYLNCAKIFKGGWWYCDCQSSNLNGPYGNVVYNHGMTWKDWRQPNVFMKFTEMKIRRK